MRYLKVNRCFAKTVSILRFHQDGAEVLDQELRGWGNPSCSRCRHSRIGRLGGQSATGALPLFGNEAAAFGSSSPGDVLGATAGSSNCVESALSAKLSEHQRPPPSSVQVPVFVLQGAAAIKTAAGSQQGLTTLELPAQHIWFLERSRRLCCAFRPARASSLLGWRGARSGLQEHLEHVGATWASTILCEFCRIRALSGPGLRKVCTGGGTEHRLQLAANIRSRYSGVRAPRCGSELGRGQGRCLGRSAGGLEVALASFGKLWQMWLCSFARSFSALAPREACLEGHALATALPHAAAAPAPAPAVAVVLPGVGSGVGGAKCEGRAFARPSPNSLRGRYRSEGGPLACAGTGIALGPRPKFRAPEQCIQPSY